MKLLASRQPLKVKLISFTRICLSLLMVQRQRFQILVRTAPFVRILDVVSKAFRELLPHTPIRQFGINRSIHFSVGTEGVRNAIGRKLAPLEPWGDWGEQISKGSGKLRGGMLNVSMLEQRVVDK